VENDKIPDSIMSGVQVGQVRFMLIGLGLVLLSAFRPQGILGNKEEMALDDR
jgi:branched-chain amino acid transport system permease protein